MQVIFVLDSFDVLIFDQGWDIIRYKVFLIDIMQQLYVLGVWVFIFVDLVVKYVEGVKVVGVDCIEFYIGDYVKQFEVDWEKVVVFYVQVVKVAWEVGLGINVGYDFNLDNFWFYQEYIEGLFEVFIGYVLIFDVFYFGFLNIIQFYLWQLGQGWGLFLVFGWLVY